MKERVILHIDMNNCYASIELLSHPEWRGKPVAVAGEEKDRHGIILAKSQEAKALGVRTGEPIWQALQKCPDLILSSPHFDQYLHYSKLARNLYSQYTQQVEPFGLDECWLDVTGSVHLFGSGQKIAEQIRQRVKNELGVTVSIGVSFTKTFAKLGSDLRKPDAVTLIPKSHFREIVWPLPVQDMIGIGPATLKKLHRYNISTLGELAACDPLFLQQIFGISGKKIWKAVHGFETSPVLSLSDYIPVKSIGNGLTYPRDLVSEDDVYSSLQNLAMRVSRRLKQEGYLAQSLELLVKDTQLRTHRYSQLFQTPTASAQILSKLSYSLFLKRYFSPNRPVRALTVRCAHLVPTSECRQLTFLQRAVEDHWEKIDHTIYEMNNKYGKGKIGYALGQVTGNLSLYESDIVVLPVRSGSI